MEPRWLLTINAELNLQGNALITAVDAGDVDDIVQLSIVGGDTLLVASPDGVATGPGFNSIDANSASAPLATIVGGEIRVSTSGGDDLVELESSPTGILTLVDTGVGSDEVRVGTPVAGIDGLIGVLDLIGGDHGLTQTQLTIKDDANSLETGDRLSIFDASTSADHDYQLSDVVFQRTTLGAETAPIRYVGFETIDLDATLGATILNITGTPSASRLTVTTHDANDQITIEDTGADTNTVISSAGGTDSILIRDTGQDGGAGAAGLGSFLAVDGGDGADLITLERNGDTSRVQLDGGASADQINLISTAIDSVTLVRSGAGSDVINVSSNAPASGHLDNIRGRLCIDGGDHDPGAVSLSIKGDDNPLDAGDVVNLSDAESTADHAYLLTASTFRRTTLADPTAVVEYSAIETLNIEATQGSATFSLIDTAPSVNTTVTTQDLIDEVAIDGTGDDSNLTIVAGGGEDVVVVSDTGADSGGGASGLGSFLRVDLGLGADSLTLAGNGLASRLHLQGQDGPDTFDVQTTAVDSVTLVEAGAGNDAIHVSSNAPASGNLNGIQGQLCIDGQQHGPGQATLTIKGDANSLDSGDVLTLSDSGSTGDHIYDLDASTFRRTTLAASTAPVEYLAIETLNIATTQGAATILVASTGAGTNTDLATQDAADLVVVNDTGADSNLTISTNAGEDGVLIRDTGEEGGAGAPGLGSFVRLSAGDDRDSITLQANGSSSRVQLEGQGGADEMNVQATETDSVVVVLGGAESDLISLASIIPNSGDLSGIQGRVCVDGQDEEVGVRQMMIKGDVNSVADGDTLTVIDAQAIGEQSYELSATMFQRTTLADTTAPIEYLGIENLNVVTGRDSATVRVVSTAPATTLTLETRDAADRVTIEDTGKDSNVHIVTGPGEDVVHVHDTGDDGGAGAPQLGSFLRVAGGSDADAVTVEGNGLASRIWLEGSDGSDTLNIQSTTVDSVTVADGNAGSDTINISSNDATSGDLAGILGRLCIDGQDHDPGQTTLTIKGDDNSLDSGDMLNLVDADSSEVEIVFYDLSDSLLQRTSPDHTIIPIEYAGIETLNVLTTQGAARVTIASTAPATNTNLTTQNADDTILVDGTGADSNLTISAGAGGDDLKISDTGADGGAGAADLGSFLHAIMDDGADTIDLAGNGQASRLLFSGGGGEDDWFINSTALESTTVVEGGSGNDFIVVGDVGLDTIQGRICIDGGTHDPTPFGTTIKSQQNILDLGDQVHFFDAGSVADHMYELTASTFQRTTVGDESAAIEFLGMEEFRISTTEGIATVQVLGTPDATTTDLTSQDAEDLITIDDTGRDSNVHIFTGAGDDQVSIRDTGEDGGQGAAELGSFLHVTTDRGRDTVIVEGNGAASYMELSGRDDADEFYLRSTAPDSLVVIEAGLGNDLVNVSSSAPDIGDLNSIQGQLCLFGGEHEVEDKTTLTIKGDSNSLATGDILTLIDTGATAPLSYLLDSISFSRTDVTPIEYRDFESIHVATTQGEATVVIDDTALGANTTVTTQDADDKIQMVDIGNGSNVVVSTGAGKDVLGIRFSSTGLPDPGSFLMVRAGENADTITLNSNGLSSRVQLSGDGGADEITLEETAAASVTVVEGGAGNDQIHLGPTSRTLDPFLGDICVDGGGQDLLGREIIRTGQVVPGIPYTADSRFVYEEPVAIDAGDTLNIFDAANAIGHDYRINSDSVTRDDETIAAFDEIETINLIAGDGNDQLVAELPMSSSVVAFVAGGQTDVDRFLVEGNEAANQVRIASVQSDPNVRSPFEIEAVELIQVRGGSALATDADTLINDTEVPALLLGEGGNDQLVGGTGTDVAIGGTGIDAMFGNTGDDFLIADVSLLSVDIEPPTVSSEIEIHPSGGDLIFGNLGEGNDLGALDEAVALVPPGSDPDFVDEVEFLIENGAVKGVWSWLLARFPEPSEESIQDLVDRAISRLVSEAAASSLTSGSLVGSALDEAESESLPSGTVSGLDVNRDGHVSPIDALLVINQLNQVGALATEQVAGRQAVDLVLDVNGDGYLSPIDALQIFNYLNDRPSQPVPARGLSLEADFAAAVLALDLDDDD